MKTEDVKKIAMIGAGDMGHGIAACFLQAGYTVVLRDVEQRFVDKGIAGIKASFDKFKAKGKMTVEAYDDALAQSIGYPVLVTKLEELYAKFQLEIFKPTKTMKEGNIKV